MRKLFGFGSKLANKLTATKFVFSFTIHNLSPWPHGQRAIAIGWQRGKDKRGATRSVYPSNAPGRIGTVVRFNERFEVHASLYKAANGSAQPGVLGPFKKKCIILAVLETDGRTQATAALGRVVIDLAEFAAIEQQETRMFQVSCNKSIHSAVGDPQLTVSVRCRWKNSSATAGAAQDIMIDETGSMSTDTTGSRMTANLSSFLRFKYNSKGQANEEQDLQGFDTMVVKPKDKPMGTIQEGPDEASPDSHGKRSSGGGGIMPYSNGAMSPPEASPTAPSGGLRAQYAAAAAAQQDRDSNHSLNGGFASMALNGDRDRASPIGPGTMSASASGSSLRDVGSVSGARSPRLSRSGGEDTYSRINRNTDDLGTRCSLTPARSGASDLGGDMGSTSGPSTYTELLTVAATEVCVHLARTASQGRRPHRNMHAMARRVARTMVCLGQVQGTSFGRTVVSLVEAQARSASGDLAGMVFWWSNVVHLRTLLTVMGSPEYAVGSMPSMRWASDALIPDLLRVERTLLFDRILNQLWASLLAQVAPANAAAAAAGGAAANGGVAAAAANGTAAANGVAKAAGAPTKRAMQEAAIKQWFQGLDGLSRQLNALGSRGHVALLRQQVLLQCLKRLDALLFYHLLTGPEDAGTSDMLQDYDTGDSLWGTPGAAVPMLDDSCLPFARGQLTFGSGMSVKMTVTRLQQWASSEGLAEVASMGGASMQFPLLRTTADLLMMPKELLLEQAIRRDVKQALSIRSMVHVLEHFQTDEYAHDSIAPEVIAVLKEEQSVAPSARPPLSDLSLGYRPPGEDVVLHKVPAAEREPGVEYDAESEGEIEELGQLLGGGHGAGVPSRIRMLHQLWALGVPRKRAA